MPLLPETKKFKIYRSSAGSGKTYTLTREYLKLALQHPWAYKSILAVTFTNKATQEMKERILGYLKDISSGKKTSIYYELQNSLLIDDQKLEEKANTVLRNILHDYSNFSVSTIDSFFQKVIRAFARETGLHATYKIELDQDKVLNEVIDKLIMDVGIDQPLTKWLIQYAETKVLEGASWEIRRDIRYLAKEIFKEEFKSFEKQVTEVSSEEHFVNELLTTLIQLREIFEKEMKSYGQQAITFMEANGLKIDDFAYGYSGVAGYLNKIKEKKDYEPGDRAKKAALDVSYWYSKSSSNKHLIADVVERGLQSILQEALNYFSKNHTRYYSALELLRYVYSFGILADIATKLKEYRDENSVLLISDAAVFLKDIIGENDAPYVYEKTGSQYKHFLIDEFQDTSGFQWDNFKPLVKNSLAEGNINLVVGDVKQSVYRWRGGDLKILLEKIVEDIGEEYVESLQLDVNYRSRSNVISFNNEIFEAAPKFLKNICLEKITEEEDSPLRAEIVKYAQKISEAYKDAIQQAVTNEDKGASKGQVRLMYVPEKEDEETGETISWREEVLRKLPQLIENLQDNNYEPKDVAFLVRTKDDGKQVADFLLQYASAGYGKHGYSYEVISSESLYLTSASTVSLLVNILRYLHNASDFAALGSLLADYQEHVLIHKPEDLHELLNASYTPEERQEMLEKYLPSPFLKNLKDLQKLPLYELVETLILIFELGKIQGEYAYLQSFLDLVLNYTRDEVGDLGSFLEWWDDKGCERTVQLSEQVNAMRILTIHKSKGLQYKALIIPFCDWKLDHNTLFNNILWSKTSEEPFDKFNFLPIKYTGSLLKTVYKKEYYEELIKAHLDNLNLLYVAFTRAEDALFAFSCAPSRDKGGSCMVKSAGDLVYKIMDDYLPVNFMKTLGGDGTEIFQAGVLSPPFQKSKDNKMSLIIQKELPAVFWRERLSVRKQSGNFFRAIGGEKAEKIELGVIVHQALSQANNLQDLEKVIQDFYFQGLVDSEEQILIENLLNKLLNNPLLASWYQDFDEVKSEIPILTKEGYTYRPDRVVIKNHNAIVIDFKTGQKEAKHEKQVKNYMFLLNQMGYPQITGYLFYLSDQEIVKVE